VEASLRLRPDRLTSNEVIEDKVKEIKSKLNQHSSVTANNKELSLFNLLTTKYRFPVFIGVLTFMTGSFLLYKFASSNDRSH
jgi:hypothetical protein